MTELILTVAMLAIVYFTGYIIGRKSVIDEIKQMTTEFENMAKREGKE